MLLRILCEGRGGRHRLRADYRAFPSRVPIFQIENVVGDQPGDFHMKGCFPSEINVCYHSLTFFFPALRALCSCVAHMTVSRLVEKLKEWDRIQYTLSEWRGGKRGCMLAFLGMKAEYSGPCITSYHKQRLGLMHYLLAIIRNTVCIGRTH